MKTIRMRRYSWDPNSMIEVDLKPITDTRSAVSHEGEEIGTVESYEGRITTKIAGTRLVRSGKLRKLWQANRGEGHRSSFDHASRADAIRYLLH